MEEMLAIQALSALANASRLGVFRLLVRAGPDGISAGDIAQAVGTPANTMSGHLAILARAGLVASRRDGRTIYYALSVEGVRALFGYLIADCCDGRPELCAPLLDLSEAGKCCPPKRGRSRTS